MNLTEKQLDIKAKIQAFANLLDIDPDWAVSVALVESSLGEHQVSRTGCFGVFQMSSIAMADLRQAMARRDEDKIDIACGCAFLCLLLNRWKSIDKATAHFCDPADRSWYVNKVLNLMEELKSADT